MRRRVLALAATILFGFGLPAAAKTDGTLAGVVRDVGGKPLPGVTVTVASPDLLGGSKAAVTSDDGSYRFPALPPGDYQVRVELFGFDTLDRSDIQIQINQPTTFSPVLTTGGDPTMTVEMIVVEHESVIRPEQTQVSTPLNNQFVDNIPVLGRSYQTLLLLAPGVSNQDGNGFWGSANVNAHGARSDANQYMFDGGNTTDTTLGTFGTNFNQDAVDQIEVITAGYKAEFGRSDGAISNVLTKSGGNEFEGSFRVDVRDSALDKQGSGKGALKDQDFYRRYYSATLGGPIMHDRLWFFTSLYYQDRKDVQQFTGSEFAVQNAPAEFYDYFGKLTYQMTDNHQLVFSYHADPATIHNSTPDGRNTPSARSQQSQGGEFYLLKETAVFSSNLLLESLAYVTDNQVLRVEPDSDAPASDAPWSGFDSVTNQFVGRFTGRTETNRDRNQFREDLSVYVDDALGSHDMKLGLGYELEASYQDTAADDFYTLENGVPVEKTFAPTDARFAPETSAHARIFTAYLQDSWSPRPGLTLNLGVRADYEQLEWNGFTGSDRVFVDPAFSPDDATVTVDELDDLAIAPRLGFSWDPRADGRNVVRGSASRFYTTIPGYAGNWDRNSVLGNSIQCDTDAEGNCVATVPPEITLYYLDRDIHMPWTDEVTLGYERELAPELALSVTAIYRSGHDLLQDTDPNTYYTDEDGDGFAEHRNRVNPNFQTLFVLGNGNRSRYQAVELSLRKRLSGNWQLLGSYTYSVAKGDGEWGATAEGDDARLRPFEYSYLPYDQRHVVKLDGTYFLPLDFIVSASARYLTGTPYTVNVKNFVDLNGSGYPDTGETGSIAGGGTHYIGQRNSRRNDDYFNLDLRAEKAFVWRGVSLGVFADLFNVMNDQSVIATNAAMLVHDPNCDPSQGSCPAPGTISEVQTKRFGRRFQLGFRVTF